MVEHNVSAIQLVASGEGFVNLPAGYMVDKPTVICLCGAAANHPKQARNFARMANNLLDRELNNEIDFLSIYWPPEEGLNEKEQQSKVEVFAHNYNEAHLKYIKHGVWDDILLPAQAFALISRIFLPLVSSGGNRLDLEQVHKNLRQITLVSTSYGGIFAAQIGFALERILTGFGYSKDEINQLRAEIPLITGGDASIKQGFKCLHIINLDDPVLYKFVPEALEVARRALKEAGIVVPTMDIIEHHDANHDSIIVSFSSIPHMPRLNGGDMIYKNSGDETGHHPEVFFKPGVDVNGLMPSAIAANFLMQCVNNSIWNSRIASFEALAPTLTMLTRTEVPRFKRSGTAHAMSIDMWKAPINRAILIRALIGNLSEDPRIGGFLRKTPNDWVIARDQRAAAGR